MPSDYFTTNNTSNLENLQQGSRIHFIGISGVAMGQLAVALSKAGYSVSGSDRNFYEPMGSFLKKQKITLYQGYSAENISKDLDLVVIGNVASADHPEVQEVESLKLSYSLFPKTLYEHIIKEKHSIVVTGTHGKTTTSAVIAQTLINLQASPSYFIGGVVPELSTSLNKGNGKISVVEGDEYDSAFFAKVPKFSFYKPDICIVNAIEFDHADIYNSLEAIEEEFQKLVISMQAGDSLIINQDCPNSVKLKKFAEHLKVFSFGFSDNADYQIVNREYQQDLQIISVNCKDGDSFKLKIALSGKFNAKNALACYISLNQAGFTKDQIIPALSNVVPPKRRQEIFLECKNSLFMEDFAHHPTAVREIIAAVKEKYSDKKLWVAFEPASNTSKSNIFQKEFAEAFKGADRLSLLKPQTKSRAEGILDVQLVTEKSQVKSSKVSENSGEILNELKEELLEEGKGDFLVLLLSNGSFGGLKEAIVEQFKE